MSKSDNLNKAKSEKNDEYFTRFEDVEMELKYYSDQFRDKIILCNCNDTPETSFFKYFFDNFDEIGLKKLISTEYRKDGSAKMYTYDGKRLETSILKDGGSFYSKEGIEIIKKSDIVVTNPPFSEFRGFFDILMKYEKKFLVIANINCATYKEVFPYIMDGRIWLGSGDNHLSMWYKLRDDYEKKGSSLYVRDNGELFWKVCGIIWLTNLVCRKKKTLIKLSETYSPEKYQKYDNIDAIDVKRYNKIPKDYNGIMGLPISFLDKYSPEQFKIIGNEYTFNLYKGRTYINGKRQYSRIFIKNINHD